MLLPSAARSGGLIEGDRKMKANVGGLDRILRVVAGLAILSQFFVGLQTPWALIGLVPLGTALIGYCPAYTLLGLNSCPIKAKQA